MGSRVEGACQTVRGVERGDLVRFDSQLDNKCLPCGLPCGQQSICPRLELSSTTHQQAQKMHPTLLV